MNAAQEAEQPLINRRQFVSNAMVLGAGFASWPALAEQLSGSTTTTAVSEGGFRYISDPGAPFSGGVASLTGHTLVRVRLHQPLPLNKGLDFVARYLDSAGRQPSALAGLELRAPSVMSRPTFLAFNQRYVAALRTRKFVTGPNVPVARSNMAPLYDPPTTDVVSAFTYAAPSNANDPSSGENFLLSGRPEYDGTVVIAPGDVSLEGMNRKAKFVMEQLRKDVAILGGSWSDVTGVQIYMTQPLPLVMDAVRAANILEAGLSFFPGSTPVIGFDGVRYEFEADVRAIHLERVV